MYIFLDFLWILVEKMYYGNITIIYKTLLRRSGSARSPLPAVNSKAARMSLECRNSVLSSIIVYTIYIIYTLSSSSSSHTYYCIKSWRRWASSGIVRVTLSRMDGRPSSFLATRWTVYWTRGPATSRFIKSVSANELRLQ